MKKWLLLFFVVLGLDLATKYWALHSVAPLAPSWMGYPYGGIPVFSLGGITCSLNTIGNTGAAWGLFQNYSGLLFIFRCAVIGGLLLYLVKYNKGIAFPLWLIAAGAVGNAVDYCTYGYVVDFIHFCFWGHTFPIFNIADSAISIGVILLLLAPKLARWRIVT